MRIVDLLQYRVERRLQIAHQPARRRNAAHAAGALWNFELTISRLVRRAVERVDQPRAADAEVFGNVIGGNERLAVNTNHRCCIGLRNWHPVPRSLRTPLRARPEGCEDKHLFFCRRIDNRRRRTGCRCERSVEARMVKRLSTLGQRCGESKMRCTAKISQEHGINKGPGR